LAADQYPNNAVPLPGTQVPQVIKGKDFLIINGAPQNVIIVNQEQKTVPDP
jgi:hypothetical protein